RSLLVIPVIRSVLALHSSPPPRSSDLLSRSGHGYLTRGARCTPRAAGAADRLASSGRWRGPTTLAFGGTERPEAVRRSSGRRRAASGRPAHARPHREHAIAAQESAAAEQATVLPVRKTEIGAAQGNLAIAPARSDERLV